MQPAFQLENVSKRFENGLLALDDLSLSADHGERVALIGPSGCGKSTVLRLLSGLDQPTTGQVSTLNDQTKLGYVFQEATLLPWANVLDNVYMPLRLQGVSKEAAKADILNLLERLGLGEFQQAFPRELSGGMAMRVSIARALITKPMLLLMDEPFAALDEITRNDLNDLLIDLHREQNFTLLFVTHSVFESTYLANRVAIMTQRPGQIACTIPVPSKPDSVADWRTHADYIAACGSVSAGLRSAMNAGTGEMLTH